MNPTPQAITFSPPVAIKISVVNRSTLFPDAQLRSLTNALQIQATNHFYPFWGVAAKFYYTPTTATPSLDHWILSILDDADQANALGYHDVTPAGQPLGKGFVRTTQTDGGIFSVTMSHEDLEMLVDPYINLSAQDGQKFYSYEVADAVEADALGYDITIPANWPDPGTVVRVSDFVLPSWFESFRTTGPFDFLNHLSKPLELAPGGYISMLDLANLSLGWQQVNAKSASPAERIASRPHVGSRRSRRALDKSEWVVSTYKTDQHSSDAQPAENPETLETPAA
jgi:hypothetical protein